MATRLTAAAIAALLAFAAISAFPPLSAVGARPGFALADGSLQRGDQGDAVAELQRLLRSFDCFDNPDITAYFGAATEDGVRKFQSTHGLTADGVAGAQTLALLHGNPSDDKPQKVTSVSLGMSGENVKTLQRKLKDLGRYREPTITGYFGPKTEAAVKDFQQAAGLKADGLVGKQTSDKLFASHKADTLVPGMRSSNVGKLQQRLLDLGYTAQAVSGFYDQATQKAVKDYQKLNGLAADGIAGKQTCDDLYAATARTEKVAFRNPIPPVKSFKNLPGQTATGQAKGAAVVATTKTLIGLPYVSGAAGPNKFECSGLTYYVYQQFGVTLPRKAYGQGYTEYGLKITDRTKLLPGDLVFFNADPKDSDLCDHVGIYIGGGNIIHAPAPGMKVRIGSVLTARDFSWARRVFN
jgi:peptidoglycan hydrolase-like protein with peptidoglycan-binding domain